LLCDRQPQFFWILNFFVDFKGFFSFILGI